MPIYTVTFPKISKNIKSPMLINIFYKFYVFACVWDI